MRNFLVRSILCMGLLAAALPAAAASARSKAAADVNRREVDGSTPLQWAVYQRRRRRGPASAQGRSQRVSSRITTARRR